MVETYVIIYVSIGGLLRNKLVILLILFDMEKIEFFIACLVLALEYSHTNGILHRDVKPENLVFDDKGYLHLTDLGIARIWRPDNSADTSGTPGYMGTEIILIV